MPRQSDRPDTAGRQGSLVGYAADISASFDIFEAIRRTTTPHIATAGNRAGFEAMVRAMELHGIRPAISRDFPVDQIAAAFECLQQGGHFGKVIVRF
jgi:D-arabinose 1-dehydrogenase-like Zn-dependent alcohol dehydrogenase